MKVGNYAGIVSKVSQLLLIDQVILLYLIVAWAIPKLGLNMVKWCCHVKLLKRDKTSCPERNICFAGHFLTDRIAFLYQN